jgi:hypothetical protein
MSRISSLPSDPPSSAIVDPKSALRQQIVRLESKKDGLKRNAQIPPEKIQVIGQFTISLSILFHRNWNYFCWN